MRYSIALLIYSLALFSIIKAQEPMTQVMEEVKIVGQVPDSLVILETQVEILEYKINQAAPPFKSANQRAKYYRLQKQSTHLKYLYCSIMEKRTGDYQYRVSAFKWRKESGHLNQKYVEALAEANGIELPSVKY